MWTYLGIGIVVVAIIYYHYRALMVKISEDIPEILTSLCLAIDLVIGGILAVCGAILNSPVILLGLFLLLLSYALGWSLFNNQGFIRYAVGESEILRKIKVKMK